MNLYKKYPAKPYSFLFIDVTLLSDNLLSFRKNLLERIQKLVITIDKIRHKKPKYNINGEAAKISALSSGKIDKYEYLMGEEIKESDRTSQVYLFFFKKSFKKINKNN